MLVDRRREAMPAAPMIRITLVWLCVSSLLLAVLALNRAVGSLTTEILTIVAQPFATLGIAMLLVSRLAWRLCGEREAVMACLAMALSVPLLAQMGTSPSDYSGWQVVLLLVAMNGFMARSPMVGGWITGLSLAVLVSMTISTLPIAISICAFGALKWFRNRLDRRWLVQIMQSLALGLIAIFVATQGVDDFITYCGSIGPIHLAMVCWTALILSALAKVGPIPNGALLGGMSLAIGGSLAILILGAPNCAGIAGSLNQIEVELLGGGRPIWQQGLGMMLETVSLPLIGIWASLRLATRNADWLRHWWFDYTVLLVAVLAITAIAPQFAAFAAALSAVPLGWQLLGWLDGIGRMRFWPARAIALIALAVAIMPSMAYELIIGTQF